MHDRPGSGSERRPRDDREEARLRRRITRLDAKVRRRAREAAALARVSRETADAIETRTLLSGIAAAARAAAQADGAYVETLDPVTGEVEVAAATGRGVPEPGTRLPFPGTLSEEAARRREPEIVADLTSSTRPTGRVLERVCGRCSGLVSPLVSEREVVGALVVVRRPDSPPFTEDEVDRVRTLSDLGALALRHVLTLGYAARQARQEAVAFRRAAETLNAAPTVDAVARELASVALDATGATGALVERLSPDGERLEVIGRAGSGTPPLGRSIPYRGSYAESAIGRNEVERVADVSDAERRMPPELSELCPHCTAVVVPLADPDHAVGTLVLLYPPGHGIENADELARIRAFGSLAALALRKMILVEAAERGGRERPSPAGPGPEHAAGPGPRRGPEEAEALLRTRARQQRVVARLGERALSGTGLDDLLRETVLALRDTLDVPFVKVLEYRPGWNKLLLREGLGWKPGLVGSETVSAGRASQGGYTLRSGHPVISRDLTTETRFRSAPFLLEHGVVSGMSVVIGSAERPWGVLGVYATTRRTFTEDDVAFLQAVANVLAATIERLRVESEQRLIADVSAGLAATLDYDAALRRLAELVVPGIADMCVIDVAVDGDQLRRVAAVHRDPEKRPLAAELLRYPPDPVRSPLARCMFDHEARLIRESTDEWLRKVARDERHLEILRSLAPRSMLHAPLIARSRTIGLLTLVQAGSGRCYGPEDLDLVTELARRAAVAVDNARLYEAAEAANRAKSDFLTRMSHELRTPLNAIVGYADLLLGGVPDPPTDGQREQVRRIRASAIQLTGLIDEILTFSRLESRRERVQIERTDLALLVRQTADLVAPDAREKGLWFEVDVPGEPVPAETDATKVRRILLNVLANAVAFTNRGGIRVMLRPRDDEAVIEVTDTGIGIAQENLERIFEPFWQVESGLTRRVGGTGVGLTVARRLARMLGGDVVAESELEKGSTFRIVLPLRRPS